MCKMRWQYVALMLGAVLMLAACGGGAKEPWTDTFDDEEGWELSSDAVADVTMADGKMQIHILLPGQVAWASAGRSFRDARIAVDATQVAGPLDNEYGVLLRMQGDDAFYAFSVSGDGYVRVARYQDEAWTVLGSDWTASEAVHQGAATNHLEIAAQGANFTFSVNGEQVAQVEDDALRRGDVGLYAGAFGEGGVVIAFDDLTVTPLP
ncbi:MAG: family 16 glycoside hydrolase [Anaerolineales bacterium]